MLTDQAKDSLCDGAWNGDTGGVGGGECDE